MSQDNALTESELHLAVEQLRTQHTNTLDLYKSVAALLFFQYGTTPTTNRMYQLVRKGSMSAPAEALRLFWQELRERSFVRMEQADIPSSLKQSAGVLISQLWEEGLAQALINTEKTNQIFYTKIALAEKAQESALEKSREMQQALLTAQQQLQKQDQTIDRLEKELQQNQLNASSLELKVQNLYEQKEMLEKQHDNALLSYKEQIALNEQRTAEMEKYARLEIERARQEAIKTQKQDQERLTEYKNKNQTLQNQLQKQLQQEISLQQGLRHLQLQRETIENQLLKTEQQNQELRTLLQQLQKSSVNSSNKIKRLPSRLSQLRNKK